VKHLNVLSACFNSLLEVQDPRHIYDLKGESLTFRLSHPSVCDAGRYGQGKEDLVHKVARAAATSSITGKLVSKLFQLNYIAAFIRDMIQFLAEIDLDFLSLAVIVHLKMALTVALRSCIPLSRTR
jgi:hypothetical protein